ncbi:hypothetical protein Dsin_019008 [Dipteronia sinensis]|uniref:Reverse transcriptase domain-containing protein n=1 Tax=Dipteronia sinensis TaxID=43782 RepID=A0AAE0A6D0_9ROSI|nr:hypothetical protein Dsin_019008 [Dipteronia sinensis]
MTTVIGESQMAFVQGRQITDSFVIAEEIINKWKWETIGGLVVKIDFQKAYDSVDHVFLDSMLEGMGFGTKWRKWILDSISTPLLLVLVNGSPKNQFGMERGLRQGDPLSPFLFNIVSEGLNCILLKGAELELIKGEVFGGRDVHITHLQFADDTILFIKPEMEYVMNIKRILRCFELASGLKVNFHKSGVARVGYKVQMNSLWATALKCKAVSLPISYLGFPIGARPCSKNSSGGSSKNRKVAPEFFMGGWWRKRKINALKWDEVCRSKNKGGLGIGKVAVKNKGMLAKWVWRFSNEGKALWKRVIVATYGLDSGSLYWNWKGTHHPSFFTKAIASLYKENSRAVWVLKQGTKVIIGDGARASFWKDISIESTDLQESFPQYLCVGHFKRGGGVFTVSSFCREMEEQVANTDNFVKFIWQGSKEPITSILLNMPELCKEAKRRRKSGVQEWILPISEGLKFNVDGSSRGNPDPARIGGVLRDSRGKVLCLFSLFLGFYDSNLMELLAIKKTCSLCAMNSALEGRRIEIVSDSMVAVFWINDEVIGCIQHANKVYDCRELMRNHGGLKLSFSSRKSNSLADLLTKKGSRKEGDMVHWSL